jgi:hypothetical protein
MKKIVHSLGFAWLLKLSSLSKISFIVGSHMAWFSIAAIIGPLSGAFGGVTGSYFVFIGRLLLHCIVSKTLSLSFLAFCIPGFFASLCWATRSKIVHVLLPVLCILLFILHPVGGKVAIYSMYWFIPLFIYTMGYRTPFLRALESTFIAHAVGSVIWLYTVPMAADMWMRLIPIVALERFVYACGMSFVYYCIINLKRVSQQLSLPINQITVTQ